MVKMLSLRAEEMTDGMMTVIDLDRRRLRRAKRALEPDGSSCSGSRRTSRASPSDLSNASTGASAPPCTSNVTKPVKVPDSFRGRIAEDNQLDMELYEYALGLLRKRSRP